jgi:hypothetical protein
MNKKEFESKLEKHKTKIFIFIFFISSYAVLSIINNPVSFNDWGVPELFDSIIGIIISIIFCYITIGVFKTTHSELSKTILTGGLITAVAMGFYGLLNNTLEISLSTKREKINCEKDVIVMNIGMAKPQYTRTRLLSLKVDIYKQNPEESIFKLDETKKIDSSYFNNEFEKLITEFKINAQNELTGDRENKIVLVPGDKVSYELPMVANKNEVVRFDVAILGQQVILGIPIRWSRPQWTSSVVSFHTEKNKD